MPASIVTVAQQKGGAGKTTMAAQLAVAWAAQGNRVAMVDIDPQGSLAAWHSLRSDMYSEDDPDAPSSLHLSDVAGWRLSTELDRLRRNYDIVIVDCPPHAETEAKTAVRAGDITLIPIQPSPMDLWATKPTLDMTVKEKSEALLVLNRVPPRGRLPALVERKLKEANMPLAETQIGNRTAFAASLMEGKGVVESHRRSVASQEIQALAAEIDARLNGRLAA